MRNAVINKITESAKNNKNIFMITGDAGFGVLDEFQKNFTGRFLNLGIAEQNTISFAAGLGLTGYKVFVYNIVPFVMFRCYEQVRNDICYQKLPVTLIGIGSGVTYAPQGVTHYSVEDIALAKTLPNLTIFSPADPFEAEVAAEFAIKADNPVYIRIAKNSKTKIHSDKPKDITKPIVIKEGRSVAVLFHGSVGIEVIESVKNIKESPKIISVPMLQPLNFNQLKKDLKSIKTIITVEEHFVNGGLGSTIADWIIQKKLNFKLIKLGIKNEFIHAVKNNTEMRQKYGIASKNIKTTILKTFKSV